MNCGQCGNHYKNEAGYLAHTCEVTGVKPTEPETMGKYHARLAEAAQERAAERKTED
jgi:hypothetical protein